MNPGKRRQVPRIALTPEEAAESLGVGITFFTEEVRPEVKAIRRRSKVLFAVAELERWADENSERTL